MKECPACGLVKADSEFARFRQGRPVGRCRPCKREYDNDAYKADPERARRRVRRSDLKRRHGLSEQQFAALAEAQAGRCAICRATPDDSHPFLDVYQGDDGNVRGLLCHRCGAGIRFLNHDPSILRRAADYVRRGGC